MRPDNLASMDTQKNQVIKLDTKSQLAKLIATENIEVQHNNVKTASFDTLNRILTLPTFKEQSGDVYDMLIAHECSHALWTPADGWKSIASDNSLRSYVNVLEDCRIDKKIQKSYPGVVNNYKNGFDILEKQNFFGTHDKNINKDLMLIDKINLYYKSSKRLPFNFSPKDKKWLDKVDSLKTFKDVVNLAKEMLDWQKKQVEQMMKLPDFDLHAIAENYDLDNGSDNEDETSEEQSDNNKKTDDEIKDDKGEGEKETEKTDEDKKETDTPVTANPESKEGGGDGVSPIRLRAITDDSFEERAKKELYDSDESSAYNYFSVPEPKLDKAVVGYKTFLKEFRTFVAEEIHKTGNPASTIEYINWLKDTFKKFKNENKKTVMYLVKEFEMKKSANSYKRATIHKTGIIDPLKLKEYKYNENIFKKLTIIPDAKNHGMMMLLDWSGSMCDTIQQTVEQLMNLVWFCQKVNIPFEVYFFTSEYEKNDRTFNREGNLTFNYKSGDGVMSDVRLVCIANNKMKKRELDESLMYVWHMSMTYSDRYTSTGYTHKGDRFYLPGKYYLGSTPLNEALVVMNKMIPIFKSKNSIEKMTLITLTDGGANSTFSDKKEMTAAGLDTINMGYNPPVVKYGKKQYTLKKKNRYYRSQAMTGILLQIIKEVQQISTVGFYVTKRFKSYQMSELIPEDLNWKNRELWLSKFRSNMNKQRYSEAVHIGYNKYFLLNGKKLKVENVDLSTINDSMKAGGIKRIFAKSMKNRLQSRTLLNKFIEEVA